jgi:hypothetical protein
MQGLRAVTGMAGVRLRAPRFGIRLWLVGLGLIVALGCAIALQPTSVGAYSDGYVDTDVLNLRDGPGTWAPVISQMWQGEYVGVLDGPTADGWYYVDYQGRQGWAYGGYLGGNGQTGWANAAVDQPVAERWVDVNRSTQTVTLYEGNVAIASYWAALGWDQSSDGFYSTAIGTYYVYSKYRDISWTEWGQAYIKFWVGFDPGRLNGFHSYSLDVSGNVLPNGAGATGGCIALALGPAEVLYDFVSQGTRVEVH